MFDPKITDCSTNMRLIIWLNNTNITKIYEMNFISDLNCH